MFQLILHLVGDYITQSQWMANGKTQHGWIAAVHATVYALPFALIGPWQAVAAPPGYLDAVRYQLAIRLAMEWNQELKPGVAELASEALAKIQRRNAPTPQMDVNPGVLPIRTGRTSWSRLTGDFIGDS